jgi:chemotaxis protein histidine kinase CheA
MQKILKKVFCAMNGFSNRGNQTMRLQNRGLPSNDDGSIVRFVPPTEFRQEATEWMSDVTDQLTLVERRGGDDALTDHISRSMAAFHRMAALRGLNEVADLAHNVAIALEHAPGKQDTARRVVALSLAAVSQIQWMLNPSVEGAGYNARRIVDGLLRQW